MYIYIQIHLFLVLFSYFISRWRVETNNAKKYRELNYLWGLAQPIFKVNGLQINISKSKCSFMCPLTSQAKHNM